MRPWCTSTPLYSKRARYSVHLNDSCMGDLLERKIFFADETKKVVSTCLRLETRSNIHYFWRFTIHSLSSSSFFLPPWCRCTPFYSRRARYSVHLHDSSSGDFLKRSNFFIDETKKSVFNLSRLRKTLQQSLILKFHHALSIFINFLFAALVHFYSIFFWCKIICSS